MILGIIGFFAGLALLLFFSPYVVSYAIKLGEIFKVSPVIIGIVAIAIGTSLPEISNAITSSLLGHGEISVGNMMGANLYNVTVVLGLSVLIGGTVKFERKNLFLIGSGAIISTLIAYTIIEKGFISRFNGFLLIITYAALYYIISNSVTKKEYVEKEVDVLVFSKLWKKYSLYLFTSMLGIMVGAYILVSSVISFSDILNIPEYLISFFAVSFGTTLPELFVGISAVKRGEFELLIGDVFGSMITNITLAMGIGAMFRPNVIDSALIVSTGNYLIIVSIIIILIVGISKKIDRKMSLLLLGLYFLSFFVVN